MNASTITYNGLPLQVLHTTETVKGSACTRLNAIRARAALGSYIQADIMKTKTLKPAAIIAQAFDSIPDIYDGFRTIRTRLFDVAYKSEKEYRKDRRPNRSFTAADAARYFVVRWLAGYTIGEVPLPTIADISHMRPDCVLAASYAAEHRELLMKWASQSKSLPEAFWALDYSELMES